MFLVVRNILIAVCAECGGIYTYILGAAGSTDMCQVPIVNVEQLATAAKSF